MLANGFGGSVGQRIKLFRSPLATIAVLYHCAAGQSTNCQRYFDSEQMGSYAAMASMAATMLMPISNRFTAVSRLTRRRLARTDLLMAR